MRKFLLSSFSLLLTFMLIGCEWNNNQEQETPKANYDYLVLVNKQHRLPEDWEANVQLVETQNAYDETIKVEKEAFEKYNELKADLAKEWIEIDLDSVYRSVEKQQQVWDEFEQEKWLEYAQTYVAVPWYSEHHTALALDIVIRKDGEVVYQEKATSPSDTDSTIPEVKKKTSKQPVKKNTGNFMDSTLFSQSSGNLFSLFTKTK